LKFLASGASHQKVCFIIALINECIIDYLLTILYKLKPIPNHMTDFDFPNELREMFKKDTSVVVLTGAGVSAESGMPTFRGEDGLWRNYRAEELATPAAFASDPELVWEWYDMRRKIIHDCTPNPAHKTIAQMEQYFDNFQLITQNVDGLHKRAGNSKIIELHGNLWRVRCVEEGKIFNFMEVPLKNIPPSCDCGSLIRPDVVWFGESLPRDAIDNAFAAAQDCDVMLVVGTSGIVYPAASLPMVAKQSGATVLEINLEPTPFTDLVDHSFLGKAGEILPKLWKSIKKE
jgi:NAD-dependent deacetylase